MVLYMRILSPLEAAVKILTPISENIAVVKFDHNLSVFHIISIFPLAANLFFNFTGIFLFSSPSVDYHFSPLMYWSKQAHICATACTRVHVCVCVCLETVRKESWYTHIRNQHPKIKFRKYFFLWKIKMIFHHNRSYK